MNGLLTDSLKNGGGLLGPVILASAPDCSIYDRIAPEMGPTFSWYPLQR